MSTVYINVQNKNKGVFDSMDWITKMERRFGRYAIHNLMYYIIILYILGFAINFAAPGFYEQYLCLDAAMILRGQVWRIVTFLIQPPSSGLLWLVIALYFYYILGKALEATWGAFRFNLYFFAGVIFHVIAAILVYVITGLSLPIGTSYLNLSLFFAFAALYPEMEFLLFFVLPIKAKWLGIFDGVLFLWTILQGFLLAYGGNPYYGFIYQANALAAAVSILNFVIFFFSSRSFRPYTPAQQRRKRNFHKQMNQRAQNHYSANADGQIPKHRCAVCGRTELDHPELEFRYCSKCNGNYEYCQDHLFTHEHVK